MGGGGGVKLSYKIEIKTIEFLAVESMQKIIL